MAYDVSASQGDAEKRKQCLSRWAALKEDRQSFLSHWRELSDYYLPRRSKFLSGEKTQGSKKNDRIINSIGSFAVRTLGAGMMSGITSPARPWFRLTTEDPELAKVTSVRQWCDDVEKRVLLRMAKSNLYDSLATLYPDLAVFGTSCLYLEDDPISVFRTYLQPVGVYSLANNHRNEVDTVFRHLAMTVKQVVVKFGKDVCSTRVRDAYEKGNHHEKVVVIHAVEPNDEYDPARAGGRHMRFSSIWLEEACGDNEGYLKRGGYEEFPFMCPRWELAAEEAYGSSPGMMVLGDVKALQQYERRKAQAVDKIVDPPMVAPAGLENGRVNLLPGEVTYVDLLTAGTKFSPAVDINPQAVSVAIESIREHEGRIKTGFLADVWLMLAEADGKMTATEVMERHQEKLQQLGPVLERVEGELLTPTVARILGIMDRRGLLPRPPPEMKGQGVRIEYTSMASEAQQLLRTQKLDRMTASVTNLAGAKPDVLDKVDFDKVVDGYAEAFGLDGTIIRSEEEVTALRAQRAKQQAQAEAMAQAAAAAKTAQNLSQANLSGDNGLTRLMGPIDAASSGLQGLPQ